jgi:beta-glucanase (GH16 family)
MRLNFIIFFIFILHSKFIIAQICHGESVIVTGDGQCNDGPLLLSFEDNFDNDTLDITKWLFTQPWGNHSERGFNNSLEYQTNGQNYEFANGILKLMVRKEKIYAKAIASCDSTYVLQDGGPNLRWWPYTAGMIYSKDEFGYGKYEMRCKIAKGKSFWSVFWLFGIENDEIDVFEFWNEENIFGEYNSEKSATKGHMTSHTNGRMCETNYNGEDFSKQFHTYTLVWDNYKIEWFVDGNLKRRSYKFYSLLGQGLDCNSIKANEPYILDRTFPLHPKLHIGVSFGVQPGKNAPDKSTPFPSSLEIDYIRYYKK